MSSTITFYKNVPISPKQSVQFDFPNGTKATQSSFFNLFTKLTVSDVVFIRNDVVRVKETHATMLSYNYLSYKNNSKTFYCFIGDIRYINDEVTEIHFSIDYFQSYLFDHKLGVSYVEREHRNRFTRGSSKIKPIVDVVRENINLGNEMIETKSGDIPFFSINSQDVDFPLGSPYLVITSKELYANDDVKNFKIKKVDFSINTPFYVYVMFEYTPTPTNVHKIRIGYGGTLYELTDIQYIPSIEMLKDEKVIAYIPVECLLGQNIHDESPNGNHTWTLDSDVYEWSVDTLSQRRLMIKSLGSTTYETLSSRVMTDYFDIPSNPSTVVSTMKNTNHNINYETKLMNSEFMKLFIFNNYKNMKEIKGELIDWSSLSLIFGYKFIPSLDFREWVYIKSNYGEPNSDFILSDDKSIPLSNEAYLNYMLQNKATRQAGMDVRDMESSMSFVSSWRNVVGGNVMSPADSLIRHRNAEMLREAKETDLKARPDSIGNAGGNVTFSMLRGENKFKLQALKPLEFYRTNAYEFMRLFGYKTSQIKQPNLTSRYYYNYIETKDVMLIPIGEIGSLGVGELSNIYDNGVLIFHIRDINEWNTTTKRDNILSRKFENWEMEVFPS